MPPASATPQAAAAQQDDLAAADPQEKTQEQAELEAEWEARTRPSRDAPRVRSSYLRKDYSAACPEQHLAYLKCLRAGARSWLPTSTAVACQDEYKAFFICQHRAKQANAGPPPTQEQLEAAQQPLSSRLWHALEREPLFIAGRMRVHELLEQFGFTSSSSSRETESAGGSSASSGGGS